MLAAYPGYPRRRALEAIGADAMFVAPSWALADAYSAHAPTYVYRFDHTPWTLRALGLGAVHGSEIVHIHHNYRSHLGRRLHPLGSLLTPAVGRRMQRTWLDFATEGWSGSQTWSTTGPATTQSGAPASSSDRPPTSSSTIRTPRVARRGRVFTDRGDPQASTSISPDFGGCGANGKVTSAG